MSTLDLEKVPTPDAVITALARQAKLAAIYCELYPKLSKATVGQGAEAAKQLCFWMKRVVNEVDSFKHRIEIGDSMLDSRRELERIVSILYSVYKMRTESNSDESLKALQVLGEHNFSTEQIESLNIAPYKIKRPVDSESNLTGPYDAACVMAGSLWNPPKGAKWVKQRISEIEENETKSQLMAADQAMAETFRKFHTAFIPALRNEMGLDFG